MEDAILKIDGTFKSKKLEQSFLKKEWNSYSKRIRIVALITGVAYLGGLHGDYISLFSLGSFNIMLVARLVTFLMAALSFFITFNKNGVFITQKFIFLYFITITASECIELSLKPALSSQQVPFLVFLMLSYFLFFRGGFIYLLLSGLFGTIAYSTILIVIVKEPLHNISPTIIAFILVNVFSLYLVRFMNRANRTESFAMQELQALNQKLQEEIVEKKKVEEKLVKLAITDELTQVFNRRHFTDLAQRELLRTKRTERPLSFLFLDIDYFKKINDTYGHDVGDEVLKKLALTCNSHIRGLDIFGRFGGEEFAVLLPEVGLHQAAQMADRLRIQISEISISINNKILKISVSIGVSTFCEKKSNTIEQMIKNADVALYKAKENGRNQVVTIDDCK